MIAGVETKNMSRYPDHAQYRLGQTDQRTNGLTDTTTAHTMLA